VGRLDVSGVGKWVTSFELQNLLGRKKDRPLQHVKRHSWPATRSRKRALINEVDGVHSKIRGQKVGGINVHSVFSHLASGGRWKIFNQLIDQHCSLGVRFALFYHDCDGDYASRDWFLVVVH